MADEPIINAFSADNTEPASVEADSAAPDPVEAAEPQSGPTDDEILMAALGGDADDSVDGGDAGDGVADTADQPDEKPATGLNDADRRGLEVLMERGFTTAQATRMLEKDPEAVRELGAAAIEDDAKPADDQADPSDPEPETKQEPEAEAPVADVIAKVTEVLGKSFDKDEAAVIAEAIGIATAGRGGSAVDQKGVEAAVAKAVEAATKSFQQSLQAIDGHVSGLLARQSVARLSEHHPEAKTEEGFRAVYARAQSLAKTGRYKSIDELLEAAALVEWGPRRQAEIKSYKDKVSRARENGSPTAPGARAPSSGAISKDDLVLSMSLDGATQSEIDDALARRARR